MAYYAVKYSDELYHHGILGQKWGVRRYRNEDGTLTEEGKKRYGITKVKIKPGKATVVKPVKPVKEKVIKTPLSDKDKATNYSLEKSIGNTAAGMARTGSNLANRISSRKQAKARAKARSEIDVSNMSNQELQQAITRMNLERQYKDLMTSDISTGRNVASDVLADIGDVVAIGAGLAGVIASIYMMKK